MDLDATVAGQRRKTLNAVVWITMAVALTISLGIRAAGGATTTGLLLLSLAGCCLVALRMNHAGLLGPSGALLFLAMLVTAHCSVSRGLGIHDTAMLSYPVLVILGGLIFGRKLLPAVAMAAGASLVIVSWGGRGAASRDPGSYVAADLVTVLGLIGGAALAARLTLCINEAALHRLNRSNLRVWLAYELTLEGWARALEYRDSETEGHARRVTDLSVRMAKAVGLEGEDLRRVRWGALLHDIGKLAIPDAILHKAGPLDADERAVMNRHPEYAHEMLAEIPFLADCMDIPCHHHERWDGRGYPGGLAGERIPFTARLFTIIDQWDALGSDRPYRAAWPRSDVVRYVKENAGAIFDPDLVEVFLSHLEEIDPDGELSAAPGSGRAVVEDRRLSTAMNAGPAQLHGHPDDDLTGAGHGTRRGPGGNVGFV